MSLIVLKTSGYSGLIEKLHATKSAEEVKALCTTAWFSALVRAVKVCINAQVPFDSVKVAMQLNDPRYQAFKLAARNSQVKGIPQIYAVGMAVPAPAAKPTATSTKQPQRKQFEFNPNGPFAALNTMRR